MADLPDPDEHGAEGGAPAPDGPGAPLPLEPSDDHEPSEGGESSAVDICPHCGAPLAGGGGVGVACLRCGLPAVTPEPPAPIDREPAEEGPLPPPLVRPLPADPWGALAVGAAALLVLVVALLAGAHAMFPTLDPVAVNEPEAVIKFADRGEATVRLIVLLGLWTAGGVAALFAGGWVLSRPVGSLSAAAARTFAIVAVARLVTLLDLRGKTVEGLTEAALQLVAIFLLSMAAFRLKPRDALTLLAIAVISLLALFLGALLVAWAGST